MTLYPILLPVLGSLTWASSTPRPLNRSTDAAAALFRVREKKLPYPEKSAGCILALLGSSSSHFGTIGAMVTGNLRIELIVPNGVPGVRWASQCPGQRRRSSAPSAVSPPHVPLHFAPTPCQAPCHAPCPMMAGEGGRSKTALRGELPPCCPSPAPPELPRAFAPSDKRG